MQFLGLTIARSQTVQGRIDALEKQLEAVNATYSRGWLRILESNAGAWQRNEEVTVETTSAHWAVFACQSLIASDIGKTRIRLVQQDRDGIWTETENPAWSPVLRKPNHYQIRQRFFEWWVMSKLQFGNTYVLKRRDARSVVNGLYVLDPCRVRPFVAEDGAVFYELKVDRLSGLDLSTVREGQAVMVPAREIIHDLYVALFHPLVGVSPIYAAGIAALQGQKIQNTSTNFFSNGAQPGGVLTAPGSIPTPKATELKERWETAFSGDNAGKVAVLGDGLKYDPLTAKAVDAQLIEQLKWTAEAVCTVYRVPPHKISVGQMPNYNNIQALDVQYYSQCIQEKLEAIEALLDEGLELPRPYGTEFDLDDLLRMDTAALIETEKNASGLKKINESRRRLNLPPVPGGDTLYVQQQNWSLEALARRDEEQTPPGSDVPPPVVTPEPDPAPTNPEPPAAEKQFDARRFELALRGKALDLFEDLDDAAA